MSADPALLELFRAELDTHLPVLSEGLLALEKQEADEARIAAMMRAAHSIKGAARIVGLEAVVRLAHVMEDCFTAAREQRIHLTPDTVDQLLGGLDTLQHLTSSEADHPHDSAAFERLLIDIAGVATGTAQPRAGPVGEAVCPHSVAEAPTAVQIRPAADARIVLPARIDTHVVGDLEQQIRIAVTSSGDQAFLDFSAVQFISADGLAMFVNLGREWTEAEARPNVSAIGVSEAVAALFRVTALDRVWSE